MDRASSPVATRPGAELDGRYRLVRRLGVGGMGEVWGAEDGVLERHVAVKLVGGHQRGDPSILARFEREAQTGARLSHPGLAIVYDYGTAPEGVYLVMELLAGLLRRVGGGGRRPRWSAQAPPVAWWAVG